MDAPSDAEPFSTSSNSSQDSGPIRAQVFSLRDQANPDDALGFDLYVRALADFLLAPGTQPPLTISIEGPWGSGKSSFMLQLKRRLKYGSTTSTCVDFNAWKYEKQEELWAAFALTVTRSLRNQATYFRRALGDLKLYFSRIRGPKQTIKLTVKAVLWLTLIYGCVAGAEHLRHASPTQRNSYVQTLWGSIARNSKRSSPPYWIYGAIGTSLWGFAALLFFGVIWRIPENLRGFLLEVELEKYIDRPDYRGKAAFVDAFAEDFSKTVRAYAPKKGGKIFVFIDDIDRCEPPKAADLMQAMNLMIDKDSSLFFILGLDRAKVASAIAFKFREMVKFMSSSKEVMQPGSDQAVDPVTARTFGDDFLEKFIQLSFRIPAASSTEQAERFIASLTCEFGEVVNGDHLLRRLVRRFIHSACTIPRLVQSTRVRLILWTLSWKEWLGIHQSRLAESAPGTNPEERTTVTTDSAVPWPSRSTHDPFRIESGPESYRIRRVLLDVREIFDYNPRRIKAFLNVYRLALYIASRQGLLDIDRRSGKSEVSPEQIGAFVALTARYPVMLTEAVRNPQFFHSLEMICKGLSAQGVADGTKQDSTEIAAIWPWSTRPGVQKLLIQGVYSLSYFPSMKFVTILPAIPAPQKRTPKPSERTQPTQAIRDLHAPNGDRAASFRGTLTPKMRAAFENLYNKVQAAIDSTTDLQTIMILNKWQPAIDMVLTKDDEYWLTQELGILNALQKQIKYVYDGIKELRDHMSSIASQFVPATDIILAIDKIYNMPDEFGSMAYVPTGEPPIVPSKADSFLELGLETLESDAHISRGDASV